MDQVVHEAQLSGLMHVNKEQYHLMGGGNLFPPAEKSSGSTAASSSPEKQAVEDHDQRPGRACCAPRPLEETWCWMRESSGLSRKASRSLGDGFSFHAPLKLGHQQRIRADAQAQLSRPLLARLSWENLGSVVRSVKDIGLEWGRGWQVAGLLLCLEHTSLWYQVHQCFPL